jgi:hypothetical protein
MRMTILPLVFCLSIACSAPESTHEAEITDPLRDALIFHAAFDGAMDATFARGDARIFSAADYDQQAQAVPGYSGEDIELAIGQGVSGDALRFKKKNVAALFFRGDKNTGFSPSGWSGTISFWLSLDPNVELEPGFCDPIQITDSAYNDNAIWVDFTRDDPRKFRLGIFGELDEWNPEKLGNDENPGFDDRLVVVDQPPFASGEWTHIAIAHDALGSADGRATLYLNGVRQGMSDGIAERFQWDMSNAAIRLGVNYVGLYDELAIFDRTLTDAEIHRLHELKGGVGAL